MNNREHSRADWQQEVSGTQQNFTPVEAPWAAHYMAKKGFTAPIQDLACFVKLLCSGISLTLGISALSSDISHRAELAAMALALGGYLAWSGFRWNRHPN